MIPRFLSGLLCLLMLLIGMATVQAANTVIVTAEGLADPNADTYARDKGLLVDDLRRDARRQVIEKAVGMFVDSHTLVENYVLLEDRVMSRSTGLIKRIIKESNPWLGADGFMHLLIRAEVYVTGVEEALRDMSRVSRVDYIRQYGNPKISVAVYAQDADRGSKEIRSDIAENILKEHISGFGYRVWSEETTQGLKQEMIESSKLDNQTETTISVSHLKAADFSISGRVRFDVRSVYLQTAGVRVKKHLITSWTVKCINNNTGEEIYFNNKIPKQKSWATEDAALQDIGRMIGQEFSRDFFQQELMSPSKIYELRVLGLPAYDVGVLFKKEMIGLRPILDVDFRTYTTDGISIFELNFAGGETGAGFAETINGAIVRPLNAKLGHRAFQLESVTDRVVTLMFHSEDDLETVLARFNSTLPAALASATPERLRHIAKDEGTLEKIAEINPEAIAELRNEGIGSSETFNEISDF